MRFEKSICHHPDTPGRAARAPRTDPRPPAKSGSGFLWVIILIGIIWLLSIILPLALQMTMQVEFQATIDMEGQWHDNGRGVLLGASREVYKKTISTEYMANFVPGQLETLGWPFRTIEGLYGPLLITGSPLIIDGMPLSPSSTLKSGANIKLQSIWLPVVFYLALIVILIFMHLSGKDPNSTLKFVVWLSVWWMIWALIVWSLGQWTMSPVNDAFKLLLTGEQGEAKYSLSLINIFAAPIRIFLVGILFWVGAFMMNKARSEPQQHDFVGPAKQTRL